MDSFIDGLGKDEARDTEVVLRCSLAFKQNSCTRRDLKQMKWKIPRLAPGFNEAVTQRIRGERVGPEMVTSLILLGHTKRPRVHRNLP